MKVLLLYFIFFLVFLSASCSQSTQIQNRIDKLIHQNKKDNALAIREIEIIDTVLTKEIIKFISEQRLKDTLFSKGYGHIVVSISPPDEYNPYNKRIIRSYYINTNFSRLKDQKKEEKAYLAYPSYYTFVENMLVFIKTPDIDTTFPPNFKEKDMQRLRKIQSLFLKPTEKVTFFSLSGEELYTDKNFSIDYQRFHNGKYILELV
ncbi:hypothetical protein [Rufibacter sp. XAAS-G3-1]|uniref:hypothetical protein n=1 Tax=Rufibacter sp. XAAS-G3-1 TaxID=2729134 RepID=UPI0015E64BEF|nr:hypothetical protein [Rufibacter sp. XAAS-G3-1]